MAEDLGDWTGEEKSTDAVYPRNLTRLTVGEEKVGRQDEDCQM